MTDQVSLEEVHLMIVDCQKRRAKLTEWEWSFIEGVSERIERHKLSQKQVEALVEVWERVTTRK